MAFSFANPATNTAALTTAPTRNPFGNSLLSTNTAPTSSVSAPLRGGLFGNTAIDSASSREGQAKEQENDLKASQHELFNQEKYSDLTIKCKTREWKCHRAILCPRCPFFEAACGGQFTESSTRTIDLSDDDETALFILLQYLYTYEITNPTLLPTATSLHLLILGDKYSLPPLHTTGLQNLTNAIARLTLTDAPWAAEWYPRIRDLSQPGTDALKTQLASGIAKHAHNMIKHDAIRDLIATDGELAVLLVEKLAAYTNMFGHLTGPRFTEILSTQAQGLQAQGPTTTTITTTTAASRAALVVPAVAVGAVVNAQGNARARPRPPTFSFGNPPPPHIRVNADGHTLLPPSLFRIANS